MENILLATKLNAPLLKDRTVRRKELTDKINKGIDCGSKLTLISSPAGSGKTTVVRQWMQTADFSVSWISLDEADNDPAVFFRYLIASLKKIDDKIGIHAHNMFGGPFTPVVRSLMVSLVNDLYKAGKAAAIVLDDFHLIRSAYLNEFLQGFIENKPDFVHVIIMTREDPGFQLSKLRVRNEITELRTADLCFSRQDAYNFFTKVMDIDAKWPVIDKFLQKTEGWIAGLQLAALSVRDCDKREIEKFANEFSGSNRYIIDYLVEEVLGRLSESLREFIYATAVLDRMNAELCDFILQKSGSDAILKELYRLNLFLIPLDSCNIWFRYHHLFADSVRAGAEKEYTNIFLKKAVKWFDQNGYLEEAVHYAIRSGDVDGALLLIERLIPELFKTARLPALLTLLEALPDIAVMNNQVIAVSKAWALLVSGNVKGVRDFVSQLGDNFISKLDNLNKGLYLGLMATLMNYEENPKTENLAAQAIELIGDRDVAGRIAALNTLADAQKRNGKTKAALETYKASFDTARPLGFSFITLLTLYQYGITLDIVGKRKEALKLAEDYLNEMFLFYGGPVPMAGIVYALLAALYYEENDLPGAQDCALTAQKFLFEMSLNWIINVDITVLNIKIATGRYEEAQALLDVNYGEITRQMNFKIFAFGNAAAKAELYLRNAGIKEALAFVSDWNLSPADKPSVTREQWYFTYVRILLFNNNLDEAAKLIEYLESSIVQGERLGRLIPLLILKSIHAVLQKDDQSAAEHLGRAAQLAAPQGYIRPFLDEGALVLKMLRRLNCGNAFVSTLIEQFDKELECPGWTGHLKLAPAAGHFACNQAENLSGRELEVLRLIAKGLSNKEISGELYISINTTQWHISHIFSKLGVKNRVAAVKKAQEERLI